MLYIVLNQFHDRIEYIGPDLAAARQIAEALAGRELYSIQAEVVS